MADADPTKRCPRCLTNKPLSDFAVDKSKASGRKSSCRACDNKRCREYYERTNGAAARARYQADPESRKARTRAWADANPERVRELSRAAYERDPGAPGRHKKALRTAVLAEFGDPEACYLCTRQLGAISGRIVVDHDHRHCPYGRSCGLCRRGIAHERCNQIIGLAGDSPARMRVIAASFQVAESASAARLANFGHSEWTARSPRDWRKVMLESQGSLCFLCAEQLTPAVPRSVHVDHDHRCPRCGPSTKAGTKTCPACRRGLAHAACNQLVGLACEDAQLMMTIAANLDEAREDVSLRLVAA